eukprot:3925608-Rhodomonas_salina.1
MSPEFTALCQAQFEVVSSMLGATRCALYFRREDPLTGHLEFVPAAVYPERQRVWVVGQVFKFPAQNMLHHASTSLCASFSSRSAPSHAAWLLSCSATSRSQARPSR